VFDACCDATGTVDLVQQYLTALNQTSRRLNGVLIRRTAGMLVLDDNPPGPPLVARPRSVVLRGVDLDGATLRPAPTAANSDTRDAVVQEVAVFHADIAASAGRVDAVVSELRELTVGDLKNAGMVVRGENTDTALAGDAVVKVVVRSPAVGNVHVLDCTDAAVRFHDSRMNRVSVLVPPTDVPDILKVEVGRRVCKQVSGRFRGCTHVDIYPLE